MSASTPSRGFRTSPPLPEIIRWAETDTEEARKVRHRWTRLELLQRREKEGVPCWRDGDQLTFVHEADADVVRLTVGLQCRMWRVEDDLWAVSYPLRRIDEAYITYAFIAGDDPRQPRQLSELGVWRGPAAPAGPVRAENLQGELRTVHVPSRHLGGGRCVHIYLSPGWQESARTLVVQAADAAHRAQIIEPLVQAGRLPPVVCLGVEFGGGNEGRAAEYIPGATRAPSSPFEAHLAFQAQELPTWVARGNRFQLVAGLLESFRETTMSWRQALAKRGTEVWHQELVFGHDPALWDISFLNGLGRLVSDGGGWR